MLDALYLFVTTVLPKAGLQLAGIPLTVNIALTAIVVLRNPSKTFSGIQFSSWSAPLYFTFLAFAILSTMLALESLSAYQLAQNLVVMISPLVVVAGMGANGERPLRIVSLALIMVTGYALLQFFLGVVRVDVPGLTSTLGQDITEKTIGYGLSSAAEANKMPSTYQSGNYFGMFCALGASLLMPWHPADKHWREVRLAAIAAGYVGLVLCGSRSIVIPYLMLSVCILVTRLRSWGRVEFRRNLVLLIAGGFVLIGYVVCSNSEVLAAFVDRVINQTLRDPTAAGRTAQWAEIVRGIAGMSPLQLLRLFLFGQGAPHDLGGEGLLEFIVRFGIVPAVSFYGLLLSCVFLFLRRRETRPFSMGLISIFIALCVDQAFYYPPVIMQFFLAVGIGLRHWLALGEVQSKEAFVSPDSRDFCCKLPVVSLRLQLHRYMRARSQRLVQPESGCAL